MGVINSVLNVLVFIIGTLFFLFDLFILIRFGKNGTEKTGVPSFMFERAYIIGKFLFKLNKGWYFSNIVKNRRKHLLLEIYESEDAAKILEYASYAPLSYVSLFLPIMSALWLILKKTLPVFLMLGLLAFLCFYFDVWLQKTVKKRHEEIQREYATVLTKISLLVNAGFTASKAFEKVAYSGKSLLYTEMQKTLIDISNGQSFDTALQSFAKRGGCKEIKKFAALYKQNLKKGGPEFPFLLSELADAAWQDKKNRARVAGNMASQKLLFPIMLMFSGVILMVIVPAFSNMV